MKLKPILLSALASATLLAAEDKKPAEPAAAAAEPAAAKPAQDKLLPLITMEQAFAKALQKRAALVQLLAQEANDYKAADDKAKPEIEKKFAATRKALAELNTYMDVIYGLGGNRAYEYNRVTSEIYLRVGTVTEVFTRAIATRDAIAKQIAAVKEALDKETDDAKKKNLEAQQAVLVRRYALIVNALFNIFQVHPVRNYHFDAASRTLFLKTSDEEVAKLREQLKKTEDNDKKNAPQAPKPAEQK